MKANVAVLLVALLIAVAGAELGLRLWGGFRPPDYPPTPWRADLFEARPDYGYALRPNRTATYEYPPAEPRTITVTSDAWGLRNTHDISAIDDRLHILVVGDSFTFGEGVQEGERFTDYLQELEPGWRVDNVAMPGWGPDLMLLALDAVLPIARPDVVVVALFFDDFRRVRPRFAGLGYPIPRFELVDGRLVEVEFPKPKLWERSHLYNALYLTLSRQTDLRSPLTRAEWALNEAILDSLVTVVEAHGAETVLAYLSGHWKGSAQDRRRAWIERTAGRLGIAHVDLTGPIQSADSTAVYLPDNGHYGPVGHRIIADSLQAFLADRGIRASHAPDSAIAAARTPHILR